jgi:hypothetical protein
MDHVLVGLVGTREAARLHAVQVLGALERHLQQENTYSHVQAGHQLFHCCYSHNNATNHC